MLVDSLVGNFHQTLHELSSHISPDTLDGLKYLCQDALSEAQMNSVKTPLDLLSALEENGKISAGNIEYLVELLKSEGKSELVKRLSYGSFNEICEETNLSHKNIPQQLVFNRQYPSGTLEQTMHHLSFNNYYSLHCNEAASPLNGVSESQNHPRDRSSWEDSTREFPASGHSTGSVPVYGHQFALPSVDLFKTSSNHWQRQPGCNTYNEQLSNEQAESLRWSESVSAQSYQECSFENLSIETYHSVNCPHLPAQQVDKGLQDYGSQIDFFTKENSRLQQENNRLQQENQLLYQELNAKQQRIEEMQQREQERSRAQYISMGERYQMDKSPHGIAVIINNHAFYSTNPGDSPMPNRRGSQVDEDKLCTIWKYLGYDVLVLKNRTASNLLEDLYKIAARSHSKYDSFVCCILSHGYRGGVYGADSKPVELTTITSLFEGRNCSTLIGKPKMFFIQACRGGDEDKGVFPNDDDEVQRDGKDDKSLPSNADFLLAHSTASGMTSYRSETFGSWYISILCDVLKDHALSFHLLDMLTMVNDRISDAYTSKGFKQCPAPVYFLRKQVWFFNNHSYAK